MESTSLLLLLFRPPPQEQKCHGPPDGDEEDRTPPPQINEELPARPLQTAPRCVLEGYLYAATFRRVLMDYQKALINSAG